MFTTRIANQTDYPVLAALMHAAIHAEPSPYTLAQRLAWSPDVRTGPDWQQRLDDQYIVLAEHGDEAAGFMTLAPGGYVDFAYILASARGTGLFRQLHTLIEAEARHQQQTRLHTHASLKARPAFAALGYDCLSSETVQRNGEDLKRFVMEKILS